MALLAAQNARSSEGQGKGQGRGQEAHSEIDPQIALQQAMHVQGGRECSGGEDAQLVSSP